MNYVNFLTGNELRSRGFKVSVQVKEEAITRAEESVAAAYLFPLTGGREVGAMDENLKKMIAELAFMELTFHSTFYTATGAEDKKHAQGFEPTLARMRGEMAERCGARIIEFMQARDIDRSALKGVRDICNVFFRKNFYW